MATRKKTKVNKTKSKTVKKKTPRAKRVSRTKKPEEMSLVDWQIELRRQFGRDQNYTLKNIGDEKIFSEFLVRNPESGSTYRVAIRGNGLGVNYCACPDFATNHLGTCKHLEYTLAQLEKKRGGKTALADGFHPEYTEVFLQYGAERKVRFRAGTECPEELTELAGKYFEETGELKSDAYAKFQTFLSKASGIEHDLRCYEDVLSFVAEVRDEDKRQKHLSDVFPVGARSAHFKNLLRVPLYQYQREGALFAVKAGRCLIGDEMGLGKTIQALAAAEIMGQEFGVEKVLIVCPTSLKHQWQREIEKFTRRDATVVEGLRPQRMACYEEDTFFKIVNYDIVYRDLDFLAKLSPDLVILDEAQRIKNWETRTARSVKQIDTPYAIVLTGTPLENRLEELVSIVQFVDRHRLGPTYRFLDEHQEREEETGRVIGYKNLDQIGETLKPVLIRRQKKDVLDELPERLEKNLFVPMTPPQQQMHEEHAEMVAKIVHRWRKFGFLRESDQRMLMVGLQMMRMSCNSTFLVDHETDFSTKPDELHTILQEVLESENNKVVIFSQWTRTHELITRRMNSNSHDWGHVFFHGGVPSRKRKTLIEQFREDPGCRLFLSTDAGGVGLNLQHANVVINMDLPWNPAVLEQRIGRVHRLGQTRPVQVINFIAEGTIEQGMLSTLAFKKSLFAGILDGGEKEVFLGESRLKRFMETVEKVTGDIPKPPPQSEPEPDSEEDDATTPRQQSAISTPADNPLAGLIQNGLALLEQLTATANSSNGKKSKNGQSQSRSGLKTSVDERTGQTMVTVPLPDREILNQAYSAINALMESLRK